MLTMFRDGGFSMFPILGFGFVALGWAAWYAVRGQVRPLGFVVAMMVATLFSTATGICSDLGTTFKTLAGEETASPSRQAIAKDTDHRFENLLEGAAESMAPGIMGFTLLTLTSLLLAVGAARTRREIEA
jgi:uncharacterized membrane protein (Fun14 family)